MNKLCKNCQKEIPTRAIIDGISKRINKRKYCLECSPWGSGKKYEFRKNTIDEHLWKDVIKNSFSISECLRKLGYSDGNGSYFRLFKKQVADLNIDISHFTGQSYLKGKKHTFGVKIPIERILVENSNYTGSVLRNRLIKEGIFERKCYRCNLTEWQGEKIPLQVEHKNGIHWDNRIENLTLLCPNCHALTDTYCGKNIKINRKQKSNCCKHCNKSIYKNKKFCSSFCSNNYNKDKILRKRKVENRPSKEELQEMLKDSNFCKLGRKFGVSDNAIRKWLK